MKVNRGKNFKEYKDVSTFRFLKEFSRLAEDITPVEKSIPFDEFCRKLGIRLGMATNDVVRVIASLLYGSELFCKKVWLFPGNSNKGGILMERVSGWTPNFPWDTLALNFTFSEDDFKKIEKEYFGKR